MVSMFANVPRDWGSVPGQVIPKMKKMVLDASLLNIQHYKNLVSRLTLKEKISTLPDALV